MQPREDGLALSREILSFLSERKGSLLELRKPAFTGVTDSKSSDDNTPEYLRATRDLFTERFEARVANVHDEFSRLGLQDPTLEAVYKNLPGIYGNVDYMVEEIGNIIHKLAMLCPPAGLYTDVSDAQLANMALQESDRMDALSDKAMKELPSARTPNAIRMFFFGDFQQCCLNQIEYLRAEMLRRLGPSAFDSSEMSTFNGFGGLTEISKAPTGSLATVLQYSPKFRVIANKIKSRSAP